MKWLGLIPTLIICLVCHANAAEKYKSKKTAVATPAKNADRKSSLKKSSAKSKLNQLQYQDAEFRVENMNKLHDSCDPYVGDAYAHCTMAPRIWWQQGLAAIATGSDENGRRIGRKIWLGVKGPAPFLGLDKKGRKHAQAIYQVQAKTLRKKIIYQLYDQLDEGVISPKKIIENELRTSGTTLHQAAKSAQDKVADQVEKPLRSQLWSYRSYLDNALVSAGANPTDFDLVLFDLPCNERDGCVYGGDSQGEKFESFHRYSKLRAWLLKNNSGKRSTVYLLQISNAASVSVTERSDVLPAANPWPSEPSRATALIGFENLVNKRRKTKQAINYTVIDAVGLNARSTLAVSDIIDSPALAGALALADGQQVKVVSDEFARTRILECQRLRGATSAKEVEDCSGYQIDSMTLARCGNGLRCFPEPFSGSGRSMVADELFISDPSRLDAIAVNNIFPRVNFGPMNTVLSQMSDCYSSVGGTQEKYAAWVACTRNKGLDERGLQIQHCLDTQRDSINCIKPYFYNTEERDRFECYRRQGASVETLAYCGRAGNVDPSIQAVLKCASDLSSLSKGASNLAIKNCAGKDIALTKECSDLWKRGAEWSRVVQCGAKGRSLPKEVDVVITCYDRKKGRDEIAACIAEKEFGGDGAKLARCAIESGYDEASTAVCMVSDQLTKDQRIALQCYTHTGGAPIPWATCTAGKLAAKEFDNCKGTPFGEGDCFGESNDFRKIMKKMGIDIGPQSVVADIANVQLRLLEISGTANIMSEAEREINSQMTQMINADKRIIEAILKGNLSETLSSIASKACSVATFGIVHC